MDEIQLAASLELIRKDFNMDGEIVLKKDEAPFDALKTFLEKQIRYLLDKDFNRLLNAMYRIDISEQKVKEILQNTQPDQISSSLADAIIARERQKIITRLKYSEK